jgi:hypothetical protein
MFLLHELLNKRNADTVKDGPKSKSLDIKLFQAVKRRQYLSSLYMLRALRSWI